MTRVDEHIQQYGAVFCAPDGTPIQEADGTWEVRIYGPLVGMVKSVLTGHYGLEIVREETHVAAD